MVQAFKSGTAVNVSGASGPLDYDPETEETNALIEAWKIVDNQIVGIYTWPP